MSAMLAMAAASSQLGDGFAQFSRSPALEHRQVEVAIGVLGRNSRGGEPVYWARRVTSSFGGTAETWADGRTCPALRETLAAMRALPFPELDVPGMSTTQPDIVLDGIGYRLSTIGLYGRNSVSVTFESNVRTPLAAWVEESLKRLEPCWTTVVPRRF